MDDMEEFDRLRKEEDDPTDRGVSPVVQWVKAAETEIYGWRPEPRRLEFTFAEAMAWDALKGRLGRRENVRLSPQN